MKSRIYFYQLSSAPFLAADLAMVMVMVLHCGLWAETLSKGVNLNIGIVEMFVLISDRI